MTTDLATQQTTALAEREQAGMAALEHVLGSGDLAKLSNAERVGHYLRLCRSLGLNELSRPFDWIWFKDGDGEGASERLALYANQSAMAQLRRQHHLRIEITRREIAGELFVVEAKATAPDGRYDTATKYVPLTGRYGPLKGRNLANAYMKAETGAKRRVTLSMIGLSSPPDADESAAWRPAVIDGVGRVLEAPTDADRALAADPRMARAIGEPVFEDMPIDDDPDMISQAATADEIDPPKPPAGPRPSFRASDEDVRRWLGAWFATVKGLSLDNDDERHRFVYQWTATAGWPEAKRTESLRTAFSRMTDREAGDLLAHVRAVCEGERAALLEHAAAASNEREEPEPSSDDEDTEPF